MSNEMTWAIGGAVLCCGMGCLVGALSMGNWDWYNSLAKPSFQPPTWVFAPIWIVLYLMMGVALGSILLKSDSVAMWLFLLQFMLNLLWTPIFFTWKQIGWAFAELLLLICVVIANMFAMSELQIFGMPTVALFIPYLIWLFCAAVLNGTILALNPGK